jgi:hypothetical protein
MAIWLGGIVFWGNILSRPGLTAANVTFWPISGEPDDVTDVGN